MIVNYYQLNICKLLSTEYKKNKDILKFICKCKVETEMMFKKYLVQLCCNECLNVINQIY